VFQDERAAERTQPGAADPSHREYAICRQARSISFSCRANGHILTPDPGMAAPHIFQQCIRPGFRFREESCSLHCYSVEHAPIGDTQTEGTGPGPGRWR
jgi:hypothetical protein